MTLGRSSTRARAAFLAVASAGALAAGLAFVWPARVACGGAWPAPLDDVYIHANFARATASGHPFEWIAGQGYSSGETAPLYPLLLAPAFWLGLRGEAVVAFAFGLATLALATACAKLRDLQGQGGALALAGGLTWVSVGALAFTWFSGMEAAAFFAVTLAALASAESARSGLRGRARAARSAGRWGAAMVALRPEGLLLVGLFALLAARGARSRSPWPPLLRVALPAALVQATVMAANRALTGDLASAGARLKLLASNPYLDDVARTKEVVMNLLSFKWKVLDTDLGPAALAALGALGLLGALGRRTRHATLACLIGALGFSMLVSLNGAARYQGFRYYAPALGLALAAGALGASELGRLARSRALGVASLVALALLTGARAGAARRFFAQASENVHLQQVAMGKKLSRELPGDAIVLVGDAGAIPFFSGRRSVDALGLGGYRRLPFVRAAVLGEGAMLEQLERLAPAERPTHFALYPTWFPLATGLFGRELAHVTIENNVICGSPTKVLYVADYAPFGGGDDRDLGSPPAALGAPVDCLDVADVQSEEAHALVAPTPNSGYVGARVARLEGPGLPPEARRFDAGRAIAEDRALSFVARGLGARAARRLLVRGDDDGLDLHVSAPGGACDLRAERRPGAFTHASCDGLRVGDGDAVSLTARGRESRVYHVWLADDGR
ncbi:MAG TPA: hypothetical protein PK141_24845 [Polyangiaceae bacterium]|nr:hypothetical protein [Polyangiaceae bacterium]